LKADRRWLLDLFAAIACRDYTKHISYRDPCRADRLAGHAPHPRGQSAPTGGRPRTASGCHTFIRGTAVSKENYVVICALGQDRPGIINDLSQVIANTDCNVVDTRMTVLGSEFSLLMLVSGPWNAIAKLEDQIPALEKRLDLSVLLRRTEPRKPAGNLLPYDVEVLSLDQPGIVSRLTGFFAARGINIEDMVTSSYAAAHTGTPMFSVHMSIGIPADVHIARLRQDFLEFCDEVNLDGMMEPIRG
jgi:glycine cleavage system transcriptional repressor